MQWIVLFQVVSFLVCASADYTIPEIAENRSVLQVKCIEANGIDYCREHGSSEVEKYCRARPITEDPGEELAKK